MNCNVNFRNTNDRLDQYNSILQKGKPGLSIESADLDPAPWGECVTMKFDNAKFMMTSAEGDTKFLDARGNFYVIANVSSDSDVVDECGNLYENGSLFIGGLKHSDFLPIDDGGKLVLYMKEPGWPVDVHMIVLESDNGISSMEQIIHQADQSSRISLLFKGKN